MYIVHPDSLLLHPSVPGKCLGSISQVRERRLEERRGEERRGVGYDHSGDSY